MLLAASNPCPCGYLGDGRRECTCHPTAVQRYRAKLSGPLLDRIDLILRVEPPSREELMNGKPTQGSAEVRNKVISARGRQVARLEGTNARCNAEMTVSQVRRLCKLGREPLAALCAAHERVALTVRGHDRVLRVARTLADLDGRERISRSDIAQAVAYREFDRTDRPALRASG
jgi:magnesium chelatase family protein